MHALVKLVLDLEVILLAYLLLLLIYSNDVLTVFTECFQVGFFATQTFFEEKAFY